MLDGSISNTFPFLKMREHLVPWPRHSMLDGSISNTFPFSKMRNTLCPQTQVFLTDPLFCNKPRSDQAGFGQEDGDRITRLMGHKASCYSKKFNRPQTPRILSIVYIEKKARIQDQLTSILKQDPRPQLLVSINPI
jgi:hypothetical protein